MDRPGNDHRSVAGVAAGLGEAFGDLGEFEKKRDLSEHALSIQEREYGLDNREVAATLDQLGDALCQLGEIDKAVSILYPSITIRVLEWGSPR